MAPTLAPRWCRLATVTSTGQLFRAGPITLARSSKSPPEHQVRGQLRRPYGHAHGTGASYRRELLWDGRKWRGKRLRTVFKITPAGAVTTLHSFNHIDGATPNAGLVQAIDGSFYGTTAVGGNSGCEAGNGCGTVFKITAAGELITLHKFDCNDGGDPTVGWCELLTGTFTGRRSRGKIISPTSVHRVVGRSSKSPPAGHARHTVQLLFPNQLC